LASSQSLRPATELHSCHRRSWSCQLRDTPLEFLGDTNESNPDEAALLAVPVFYAGGEWDAEAQLYVMGGRFYDPYAGRWVTDGGGENGYKFADNNPVRERVIGETVYSGMFDDYSYYLNPLNNDPGVGGYFFGAGKVLGWTAFAAGSAGAGIIYGAGVLTTAAGYGTTTAYATATGGAVAGGTAAAMQTYAANPNAGLHEYAFGVGLGAGFGGLLPVGGFADLGGSLLGGGIEAAAGGDFYGNGLQFGGLVGGIVGGGLSNGWRAVAWQGGGAAIGGGVGYAYGGDASSALLGANLGSLGGGIAQVRYQGLRGRFDPKRIVIDIGGEGRHADALNVNPFRVTTTTGAPGRPIPNHVPFDGKRLPFGDRSVDIIHLENSPIRPDTIAEIKRVLRPGGEIRLVGPEDVSASLHQQIADAVGGRVFQTTVPTRHGVPALYTNIIVPAR